MREALDFLKVLPFLARNLSLSSTIDQSSSAWDPSTLEGILEKSPLKEQTYRKLLMRRLLSLQTLTRAEDKDTRMSGQDKPSQILVKV